MIVADAVRFQFCTAPKLCGAQKGLGMHIFQAHIEMATIDTILGIRLSRLYEYSQEREGLAVVLGVDLR